MFRVHSVRLKKLMLHERITWPSRMSLLLQRKKEREKPVKEAREVAEEHQDWKEKISDCGSHQRLTKKVE